MGRVFKVHYLRPSVMVQESTFARVSWKHLKLKRYLEFICICCARSAPCRSCATVRTVHALTSHAWLHQTSTIKTLPSVLPLATTKPQNFIHIHILKELYSCWILVRRVLACNYRSKYFCVSCFMWWQMTKRKNIESPVRTFCSLIQIILLLLIVVKSRNQALCC